MSDSTKTNSITSSTVIPPLKKSSHGIGAQLTAYLERLIMEGTFRPGDHLPPERRLAAEAEVSRTTVRDALADLEARHLVKRVQGSGTIVLDPMPKARRLSALLQDDDAELNEAVELREAVEPNITALAAKRAQPIHIAALEELVSNEGDNLNPEESMTLDIRFHLLLAQATSNALLETVLKFCFDCTKDVRSLSHDTATGRRVSRMGHQLILNAVKTHDTDQARSAMIRHLGDVKDISVLGGQ